MVHPFKRLFDARRSPDLPQGRDAVVAAEQGFGAQVLVVPAGWAAPPFSQRISRCA
jgi:hypothetical protein